MIKLSRENIERVEEYSYRFNREIPKFITADEIKEVKENKEKESQEK